MNHIYVCLFTPEATRSEDGNSLAGARANLGPEFEDCLPSSPPPKRLRRQNVLFVSSLQWNLLPDLLPQWLHNLRRRCLWYLLQQLTVYEMHFLNFELPNFLNLQLDRVSFAGDWWKES